MQFIMKNVFALIAVLAIGVSTVAASPTQVTATNNRAHNVIDKLEKYIAAGINIPQDYKQFDASGVRPQSAVEIVTTAAEASALAERHDHNVRIDVANGQLIYIASNDHTEEPTQHVATLAGEYLDQILDQIDDYLEQQDHRALVGTTPAADTGLKSEAGEMNCNQSFCFLVWGCWFRDHTCGGCLIFFCMKGGGI